MNTDNELEPLVTVCIPTYKRVEGLSRALESVIRQSYTKIKILVSDNDNSDEVERLVHLHQLTGADIVLIRQKNNLGCEGNLMYLLRLVETKYFMWLADDDWIDPDYIKESVIELESNSEFVLVSGQGILTNESQERYYCDHINLFSNVPLIRVLKYWSKVLGNSVFYGVYRTSIVRNKHLEVFFGSDILFLTELILEGKVKTIPKVNIYRALGGLSASKKYNNSAQHQSFFDQRYLRLRIIKSAVKYFFKTRGKLTAISYSLLFALVVVWRFIVLQELARVRIYLKIKTRIKHLIKI